MSALDMLLSNMEPVLNPSSVQFHFLDTLPKTLPDSMIGLFRESEGWTLIVSTSETVQDSQIIFAADWITLNVQSDLNAIGFTAAFSKVLGDEGISCNVFAANFHDHIFVPQGQGPRAVAILRQLSRKHSSSVSEVNV